MSGSSLEVIMSGQDDHLMRDVNDDKINNVFDFDFDIGSSDACAGLNPFLEDLDRYCSNQTDEMDKKMPAAALSSQSDEELARKLAAEWGSLPDQQGGEEVVADLGIKSDEDYARKLQAMWDAEAMTGPASSSSAIEVSSHVATTDDVASLASDGHSSPWVNKKKPSFVFLVGKSRGGVSDGSPLAEELLLEQSMMDGSMQNIKKSTTNSRGVPTATIDETGGDQSHSKRSHIDFERHGQSFPLFHYNGLRGGKITCFRVQKLSPTEAVGASIASSSKGGHGGGASSYDLEDVVRTKWPSSLVDWLGESPPSID